MGNSILLAKAAATNEYQCWGVGGRGYLFYRIGKHLKMNHGPKCKSKN